MRSMYVAVVEVASKDSRLHDGAEHVLEDFAPRVRTSPEGWLTIQVEVPASDVAHATSVATALARAATGVDVVACHTMTLAEHERRRSVSAQTLVGQRAPA